MGSISRRGTMAAALALAAGRAGAQPAWPSRSIQVILPYAPGGTGDVFARLVADRLRGALGQAVVVENRSGASGVIGTQAAVRALPDGHTLLFGQTSEIAIAKTFLPNVGFDAERELAPVALVGNAALALCVNAASPYRSVGDLAAAARAQPGGLTFASSGTGTPGHFAAELLALRAGARMVHVPYRGGGPALVDLLGGHVEFFFSGMPAAIPHARDGKLRILAVSTARRMPGAPEIPTVQESGIADFDLSLWGGFFAPAATPAAVVQRLNAEVNRLLEDPAVRDRLVQEGAEVRILSTAEFGAFVRAEIAKYAEVIRATGVRPD
ncbi:MAG TPA: tripartite tricarboxylate transporter substrate binding protein [Roseomonas sp.]|jgi:tripartite-type tricarboxylate transporter receptor subunit TctC